MQFLPLCSLRPPKSPVSNASGYYLGKGVKRGNYQHPHTIIASLETKFVQVMFEITKRSLFQVCLRFGSRIKAFIEAEDKFIEYFYKKAYPEHLHNFFLLKYNFARLELFY